MKYPSITELVLRDGQQSLIATRMRLSDMIPILSKLDNVGFSSLEMWGGATYDCCLRFLNEDPWERLRIIKSNVKKTDLQMLLRGKNLVGYKKYDDSVIDLFIKKSSENGINVFRIFDALNDINNIVYSIECVNKYGANSQGTISYTTSPVHNEKYWLKLAKDIEDAGAKSLGIKDMAGLLKPKTAYNLIKKLKKNLKIPIHLHTHATTGLSDATNFKAYEAGVDNIDTSISSFSNLYAHTATESLISMIYDESDNQVDYNRTSDRRLKENIVDLDNAIDVVKQLKPRKFNFNRSAYSHDLKYARANTITAPIIVSFFVGQVILNVSCLTSCKNFNGFFITLF